jgi:hypothetical protein
MTSINHAAIDAITLTFSWLQIRCSNWEWSISRSRRDNFGDGVLHGSITWTAPVRISVSSVTMIGLGTNRITSTTAGNAGIECALESNRGIGTSANGKCDWVTIERGSVQTSDVIGIGNGWGESGRESRLGGLSTDGGQIRANGTNMGAGIGSGCGDYDTSTAGNITILNRNFTLSSSDAGPILEVDVVSMAILPFLILHS